MQVTIEVPDHLARRLEHESQRLARIIARGLRSETEEPSALRREVVSFLARGPQPSEIVGFRPSEAVVTRARELRGRNEEGTLTPEEEAEMDELADIDNLVSLLKAEARLHLQPLA